MKRRRGKLRNTKGEAFEVVGPKNEVLIDNAVSAEHALVQAQSLLSKLGLGKTRDESIDYTVRLKPLFGPPDDLYLVRLTPGGAILTAPSGALR